MSELQQIIQGLIMPAAKIVYVRQSIKVLYFNVSLFLLKYTKYFLNSAGLENYTIVVLI